MRTDFIPFDPLATIELLDIICINGAKNFRIRDYRQFLISTKPLGTNCRIHYEDNPLLAIIDRLSSDDWLKFIKKHSQKEILARILEQLANRMEVVDQLDTYFQDEGRIARQLILIWAQEGNIDDQTIHRVTSEVLLQLPPYWSEPRSIEYETKKQEAVSEFLDNVSVFWSWIPLHEKRVKDLFLTEAEIAEEFSDQNEKPFIPKRKVSNFSFIATSNQAMAIRKDSIPYALNCLQYIVANPPEKIEDEVFQLIILIGILFGKDFKKVLKMGLSDKIKSREFLSENGLHLRVGSIQEESEKKNANQDQFCIPWNPILKDRVRRILNQTGEKEFIRELLGREAQDIFYRHFSTNLGLGESGVDKLGRFLDHLHINYGALRLGLPIPYLSIIQGKPFGWTRGVDAYAGIETDKLNQFQRLIENTILADAGIETCSAKLDQEQNDLKIAGAWHEPVEKVIQETIAQLEKATTRNQVLFLTNKFFLILGKRRRNTHYHPSHYFQRYPHNIMMIRDKIIAGRVPVRVLAFSHIVKKISEKIPNYFKLGELAYSQAGKSKRWMELSYMKRKEIEDLYINPDHPDHAIRRSFVNFLLKNGLGEVIAYAMTGHSPAIMQQGGSLTLQAPFDLWRAQEEILEKLFEQIGLNRLLDLLVQKAEETQAWEKILPTEKTFDLKEIIRPNEKKYLRHDFSSYLPDSKSLEIEKSVRESFVKVLRIDLAHKLAVQLTLDYHIPIDYWLSYHHYLTFNSLVFTDTNQVYFKLLFPQDDAGGIGTAPLHLGSRDDLRVQRILEIYEKMRSQANDLKTNETPFLLKKLFWKENPSKTTFGESLRKAILHTNPKTKLKIKKILKAFSKVSIYQCFVHHPGVVASCLTQRKIASLNNASLEDVVKLKEGLPVRLLDFEENPYQEDLKLDKSSSERSEMFKLQMASLGIDSKYDDIYPTVKKYARGLSLTQISHQLRRFESFKQPQQSGLAAGRMIRKMRKMGLAVNAKAFPILLSDEFDHLVQMIVQNIEEADFPHPSLNEELKNIFLLCVISGARISEIYNLHRVDLKVIENQAYLQIRKGKTDAAKRWICLTEFDWAKKHLPNLQDLCSSKPQSFIQTKKSISQERRRANFLFPNILDWFKSIYKNDKKSLKNTGISRKLKDYLEDSLVELFESGKNPISIHIIRHCYAFYSLQEIIRKHYWKGSFNFALCSLATQMGHSSFIPTVFSYVGTGCMALDYSDK